MHPVTRFRHKRRNKIIQYLGSVCVICGTNEFLEIDHINPKLKNFPLNGNYLNRSWDYLLPEINKCQLLCKYHHTIKTLKDNNFVPWNKNLNSHLHGTVRSYNEQKCRCAECKLAKRLYRNKQIGYTDHYSVLAL